MPVATRHLLLYLSVLVPCCAAMPVVLENNAIRLELEPQTFSVRFLGWPGGPNFVDTIYMSERLRNGHGLVMPGGIMTDVLPVDDRNAMLRRGPATIIEHRSDYLLLMGPENPSSGLRVKKEYILHRDGPQMTYRLSVLSARKQEQTVSVRVTAQLPWTGALKIPKTGGGTTQLLRGAYPNFSAMDGQPGGDYTMPLSLRSGLEQAVLEITSNRIDFVTFFGTWSREVSLRSAEEQERRGVKMLILADGASQTCQVAQEWGQGGVNVGAPLVLSERWILQKASLAMANTWEHADEGVE